ncbi:Phenylacetic acid catabolic protein [Ferviditalea candida]|uniref:Phenylacetic acid catabolic protein n=1 Tax=Ferviditalea candida TaxID=3108399 RepID=A0ABU5ZEP2_9BACL|nr:Phenylacetic acid catabolic protein [Paenibacillaceae bacterium T2]
MDKTERLKEKIKSGFMLECKDDMSEEYLHLLIQTLTIVADTELMSAPAMLSSYKDAPTLNNKISILAVVQDEIGHAHIALRLLKDLGVDTDHLLYERPHNEFKNPYAMDFALDNYEEIGVFNALFDRAGYTLLGDVYQHTSFGPWKRALVKVDKEELFHLRHGETIMKLSMDKGGEAEEKVKHALEWMFLMALEFFGVGDSLKKRSGQLEYKLKGSSNDELRQKWFSTAVPFFESIGVKVPVVYDENTGKYSLNVSFPCKFDMENKKWLYDQPDTWDGAIARWKTRGPNNKQFVDLLRSGRRELETLREEAV